MGKVQQNQVYKAVCGCQNSANAMRTTSAQNFLFQPLVTAVNLGVLLVQIAQINCGCLKYGGAHRRSLRIVKQFSFLSPYAGAKIVEISARCQKCLKTLGAPEIPL